MAVAVSVLAVGAAMPFAALGAAHRGAAARWVIRDLGEIKGQGDCPSTYSGPVAINERNQIVGTGDSCSSDVFLWQNGRAVGLGGLGGAAMQGVWPGMSPDGVLQLGINDRGEVAWTAESEQPGATYPLLWRKGRLINLDGPLSFSDMSAINDRGQVVGSARADDSYHAFLWQGGRKIDLGSLSRSPSDASDAAAINNQGQIVGSSGPADSSARAFLWQSGRMTGIGTPLGEPGTPAGDQGVQSRAIAISNRGQVIVAEWGPEMKTSDLPGREFVWQNGRKAVLGAPHGERLGWWGAINERGEVIGFCIAAAHVARPCLWRDGQALDLGTMSGDRGRALGINNAGQVVGRTNIRPWSGESVAFIWQDGKMTRLPSLPARHESTPFWLNGSAAVAINDRGVIVGVSERHAVEWVPSRGG